jgi:hypothetical protein
LYRNQSSQSGNQAIICQSKNKGIKKKTFVLDLCQGFVTKWKESLVVPRGLFHIGYEIPIGVPMDTNNKFPTNFSSLQGLRVLFVDNNIDYCHLIVMLLQPYGVEVQTASLAQPALEIFR